MLHAVIVKRRKELTAIRLRSEQVEGLRRMIPPGDKETTISLLIRRAVDEFLAKKGGKKR
jgi:hypothetical protein